MALLCLRSCRTAGLATVFGLLLYALLPSGIVALNDDFGYLRSVVQTLQHGRPWTDDWLEPWSAGLTAAAALIFRLSGSFYAATYGLLALLGGVGFYFALRLLLAQGFSLSRAGLVAGLGFTFPTVLWKSLEFTGVALYTPCLLAALWFAGKRQWFWLLVVWLLALATRQSAITWAVLPLAAAWADTRQRSWKRSLAVVAVPGLVTLAGGIAYVVLGRVMNKTYAQRLNTDHMWSNWSWAHAREVGTIGASLMLVTIGLAGFVSAFGADASAEKPGYKWLRVAGVVGTLGLLFVDVHRSFGFEHAAFDGLDGAIYVKALIGVSAAGWIVGRFSFDLLPAAGALAALAALTVRPMVWDYYAIDLAVFTALAVLPRLRARPEVARHPALARVVAALFVAAHGMFVGEFKHRLDRGHAMCDISSRALAAGSLHPDEPSFMPFGLQGWYYFHYHLRHDGSAGADVADFGRYLKQDAIDVAWRYAKPLRWLPDHGGGLPSDRRSTLISGRYPYFWIFTQDFLLLRAPRDRVRPAIAPLAADFKLPEFPVNDAGWRRLISASSQ